VAPSDPYDVLAASLRRGPATPEEAEHMFRDLVRGLSRPLLAFAFRYTGDWDSARDLAQETWVRVHTAFSTFDPEQSFRAWLYSIHRNVCRDHARRALRRREQLTDPAQLESLAPASTGDVDAELETRDLVLRAVAAAEVLPETQREVFMRVDVEQADQRETAAALGISHGALRTRLYAARKRLAELLSRTATADGDDAQEQSK